MRVARFFKREKFSSIYQKRSKQKAIRQRNRVYIKLLRVAWLWSRLSGDLKLHFLYRQSWTVIETLSLKKKLPQIQKKKRKRNQPEELFF